MKIAILAWGSLVHDPRELPYEHPWLLDGPKLPIEFSRVSKDARLTLVIDPEHGAEVPTRFASSTRTTLPDAVADLRDREGTVIKRIGFTDSTGTFASFHEHADHKFAHERILPWLSSSGYDAVVWTALPSNYSKQQSHVFTVPHAIAYLRSLPTAPRDNALDYIRNAPPEVETALRKALALERLL